MRDAQACFQAIGENVHAVTTIASMDANNPQIIAVVGTTTEFSSTVKSLVGELSRTKEQCPNKDIVNMLKFTSGEEDSAIVVMSKSKNNLREQFSNLKATFGVILSFPFLCQFKS